MSLQYTFGNLNVWQAGWLDANFQAVGLLGTLPCQVSGTNALVLTPYTTPTIPTPTIGLQQQVRISGIASATNTTAVTAAVGGTPALPVYKDTSTGPVALTGNEIAAGNYFTLIYDPALDGGAGGYHLNTSPASSAGTVTSVATGTGLTGGPVTTTGTISLASIASHDVLSNITGGAAPPIANTLTATIDAAIGSTQGTILYRGATVWTALGPGTSGQFLKTQGAAANPVWATDSTAAVGVTVSVDFNSGNTDTTITIPIPPTFTRYRIDRILISGATTSISTATCGVFTNTGGGGTAIVTGATAITVVTSAEGTANNMQSLTVNNQNTASYNNATLYFRVATAEGGAATGSVTIIIQPLS